MTQQNTVREPKRGGWLHPDVYLTSVYGLTPAALTARGIRGLLLDIDNTLVTYDDPLPTPPVLRWLDAMRDAGIRVAFVSNNERERVETFTASLGCPAFGKSGKPLPHACKRAMAALGLTPAETAAVGDQIFTDVLAAAPLGIYTVLVPPIKDKRTLLFRVKRRLEKPIVRRLPLRETLPTEILT